MKKFAFFLITILFININVYALEDVYIDNIKLIDKDNDVIINDFHNIDLSFNNVGEKSRYKLTIINKSNNNYYLDINSKYENINIKLDNNKIKHNSKNYVYVDISYDKLVDKNVNINDILKIKLNNDDTNSIIIKSIFALVLIIFISIGCILISKIDSRRIFRVIILGLLIIPIYSIANSNYINLRINISINYNTLLPRCYKTTNDCLDWSSFTSNNIYLITSKDKSYSDVYDYDNTRYYFNKEYDVSYGKPHQVMLYSYKSINNDILLVLSQTNGVVLPVNSSNLFRNTNFKLYDLSSINSSNTSNMKFMFSGVNTDSIDISGFNTSKVNSMFALFYKSRINDVNISGLDTTSLNNINYIFRNSKVNHLY